MELDNRKYQEYLQTEKWKQIANRRMNIDGYECQMCHCKGTSNNPLEVHHLSYKNLYNEEGRIYEDLVTLCHSCHKSVHNVMNRVTTPEGRHGWKDTNNIPKVSVFTLTGTLLEHREISNNET